MLSKICEYRDTFKRLFGVSTLQGILERLQSVASSAVFLCFLHCRIQPVDVHELAGELGSCTTGHCVREGVADIYENKKFTN